jgi:hypothetical protein
MRVLAEFISSNGHLFLLYDLAAALHISPRPEIELNRMPLRHDEVRYEKPGAMPFGKKNGFVDNAVVQ